MLVVICLGSVGRWYPVVLDCHRFFIAISRAVVNHDGRDGSSTMVCWCSAQEASAGSLAHWPYTPGLLIKWVAFLGTLHWPAGVRTLV